MVPRATQITAIRLYFIPVQMRVPLKFGHETTNSVTCARVAMRVADESGSEAEGWGETPLSVQWVWPSTLPYEQRHHALKEFCKKAAAAWIGFSPTGHSLEAGYRFQEEFLPKLIDQFGSERSAGFTRHGDSSSTMLPDKSGIPLADSRCAPKLPRLAALVCTSPFDIALHDALGKLVGRPVYQTYGGDMSGTDLGLFLRAADDSLGPFPGRCPAIVPITAHLGFTRQLSIHQFDRTK